MEKVQAKLFKAITDEEWNEMEQSKLFTLGNYSKGSIIFHYGEIINTIGIVIEGSVNIERVDIEGRRTILSNIPALSVFGESYALTHSRLMVDATASQNNTTILFINVDVLESKKSTAWSNKLKGALLSAALQKNIVLSNRIFCTTPKAIREKVETYLSFEAIKQNSYSFFIPFNREELADYLSVDRSALSKELGKMEREGLIEFRKNHFKLLSFSNI